MIKSKKKKIKNNYKNNFKINLVKILDIKKSDCIFFMKRFIFEI